MALVSNELAKEWVYLTDKFRKSKCLTREELIRLLYIVGEASDSFSEDGLEDIKVICDIAKYASKKIDNGWNYSTMNKEDIRVAKRIRSVCQNCEDCKDCRYAVARSSGLANCAFNIAQMMVNSNQACIPFGWDFGGSDGQNV